MSAIIVVEVITGIVILVVAVRYAVRDTRQRREADLQQQFAPEYDSPEHAPQVLAGGEQDVAQQRGETAGQHDRLEIRPLEPTVRDHYIQRWEAVQAEFVDQPGSALDEADQLITDVMRERGYPVEDFDEHVELVAADHPQVVAHYHAARAIRLRHDRHSHADTSEAEDQQEAFGHYRALFDELMHDREVTHS